MGDYRLDVTVKHQDAYNSLIQVVHVTFLQASEMLSFLYNEQRKEVVHGCFMYSIYMNVMGRDMGYEK